MIPDTLENELVMTSNKNHKNDKNKKNDKNNVNHKNNKIQKDKRNKKLPKEISQEILKKMFKNLLRAVGIMLYFMILNLAYSNMKHDRLMNDIEVFAGIFLVVGIIFLERAYKKDDNVIAITGVELLFLSLHSLSIMHMVTLLKYDFQFYLLTSSYVFSIYYVLKAIVLYTKGRKEYLKSLSDISEIVKKDEPVRKEAKKRNDQEEGKKIEHHPKKVTRPMTKNTLPKKEEKRSAKKAEKKESQVVKEKLEIEEKKKGTKIAKGKTGSEKGETKTTTRKTKTEQEEMEVTKGKTKAEKGETKTTTRKIKTEKEGTKTIRKAEKEETKTAKEKTKAEKVEAKTTRGKTKIEKEETKATTRKPKTAEKTKTAKGKTKTEEVETKATQAKTNTEQEEVQTPPKRKRGRPRKEPIQ